MPAAIFPLCSARDLHGVGCFGQSVDADDGVRHVRDRRNCRSYRTASGQIWDHYPLARIYDGGYNSILGHAIPGRPDGAGRTSCAPFGNQRAPWVSACAFRNSSGAGSECCTLDIYSASWSDVWSANRFRVSARDIRDVHVPGWRRNHRIAPPWKKEGGMSPGIKAALLALFIGAAWLRVTLGVPPPPGSALSGDMVALPTVPPGWTLVEEQKLTDPPSAPGKTGTYKAPDGSKLILQTRIAWADRRNLPIVFFPDDCNFLGTGWKL